MNYKTVVVAFVDQEGTAGGKDCTYFTDFDLNKGDGSV